MLATRIRNLKRTHVKLIQHADLVEEAEMIQNEINNTLKELNELGPN